MVPCSTEKYEGPQLPKLPDQFTVNIEANILQKNYTINLREVYDYPNNRVMIERYDPKTGEKVRTVINMRDNSSHTYFANQTCVVMAINGSQHFGFLVDANSSHLISVKNLLHFGDELGEKYISGSETVRGIPVHHWQACLKIPASNGTFLLDYFFSKGEGYYINGILETVPLRAVINGTAKSLSRNGSTSPEYHNFYHIYDFIDFNPGPIQDPSVFEIPVGTFCNNSISSKPLPYVPDHFTVAMEIVSTKPNGDMDRQNQLIYFDNQTKLLRLEGNLIMPNQGNNRPLTIIQDFSSNLLYQIDQWEENCTVTMVSSAGPPDSVPAMSPEKIMDIFKGNFIYQGQKTIRGIICESWADFNTSTNETKEIFFTKVPGPERLMGGQTGVPPFNHYQPVAINTRPLTQAPGDSGVFIHMYNYMTGHPSLDVFDVSSCYSLGHHYSYMAFKTEGNFEKDVLKFRKEFIAALRSAIARGANISGTRVTSILIEQSPDNNNQLRVYFKLLDNQLNDVHPSLTGPSLAQAKLSLQQAVSRGLNFDVQYPTFEDNFQVLKGSLWETMSSESEPQKSTISRYSAGSMAGLGIGMLVVGALLGLLGAFFIYKRVDSSVPYQITK